jgi:hypothetical protein
MATDRPRLASCDRGGNRNRVAPSPMESARTINWASANFAEDEFTVVGIY